VNKLSPRHPAGDPAAALRGGAPAAVQSIPGRGRSLRLHLLALVLAAMLPALVLGGVALRQEMRQQQEEQEARHLAELAQGLARTLDATFAAAALAAGTLASSPLLQEPQPGPDAEAWAREVAARLGAQLAVIEADGRQAGDPPEGPAVVPIRAPVLRWGKLVRTVTLGLDPSHLGALLAQPLPKGAMAWLVDGQGVAVARSAGAPDAPPGPGEQDRRVLAAQRLAEMPAWTVVVGAPRAQSNPPWQSVLLALAPGWAAALGLGIALALLAARRLARPVQALSRGARELVTAGVPVAGAQGFAEIEELRLRLAEAVAAARETAEREGAELRLMESVLDSSPDPVLVKDLAGCCVLANRAAETLLGLARGQARGRRLEALVPPERAAQFGAHDREVAATGVARLSELRLPARGEMRVLLLNSAPWRDAKGQLAGIVTVARDVTERRRTEAALAESAERLRAAQEAAGIGIFDGDLASGHVRWDGRMRAIWQVPPGQPVNLALLLQGVHPADRAALRAAARRALRPGGDGLLQAEFRLDGQAGPQRWVAVTGRVAFGPGPRRRPLRILGAAIEVTAQRAAEAALAEGRERLRMAVEGTGLGAWERDLETGQVNWTANHFTIFGYPVDPGGRATREMWRNCVHPEDLPAVEAEQRAAFGEGRLMQATYRIRRAGDGALRWVETSGRRLESGGRRHVLGVVLDVTERRQAEDRLREAQAELLQASRLSASAAIAAGLAHELNQPLTAATNYLRVVSRLAFPGPERPGLALAREAMEEAQGAVLRAAEIVRGLRSFIGRPGTGERGTVALPELMREAIEVALPARERGGLAVALDAAPGLPGVRAERAQLRQMLVNLLRNAAEAIREEGEQGEVTLSARRGDRPGTVVLEVADSGPGLSPELEERLFSPFVSTRRGGLGLGLAICRAVAEDHGGRIEAAARPGGGTVFSVTLPV
jgi:two-component system sensor kinase FixL